MRNVVKLKKPAKLDANKVAKLIRLLASDKPHEVTAAVSAMQKTLEAAGHDFHTIADIVEAGLKPAAKQRACTITRSDFSSQSAICLCQYPVKSTDLPRFIASAATRLT